MRSLGGDGGVRQRGVDLRNGPVRSRPVSKAGSRHGSIARSELVVNEDPKAGDIDDASVARWTVETVGTCRAQAGGGDQDVEARFTKRVAQWRQHIYDRVQSIRELVRPD